MVRHDNTAVNTLYEKEEKTFYLFFIVHISIPQLIRMFRHFNLFPVKVCCIGCKKVLILIRNRSRHVKIVNSKENKIFVLSSASYKVNI